MAALSTIAIAGTAVAAGVGAGLSAGATKKVSHTVDVNDPSSKETSYFDGVNSDYNSLRGFLDSGTNANAGTDYQQSTQSLSDALKSAAANRGLPTDSDVAYGNDYAAKVFAPQQTALNNNFSLQQQDYQKLAAKLGRSGADPILQAKMRQEQTRQSTEMNSQQGAFGAQTAASIPQQTLSLLGQRNDLLGNVYAQAQRNREYMISMGQQLGEAERSYRTKTAGYTDTKPGSGFDIGAGLSGAASGLGAGMGMSSLIGGGGGGLPPVTGVPNLPASAPSSFSGYPSLGVSSAMPGMDTMPGNGFRGAYYGGNGYSLYKPSF